MEKTMQNLPRTALGVDYLVPMPRFKHMICSQPYVSRLNAKQTRNSDPDA